MQELPLFPLRTVLFPEGPLPLRIFEPRYLAMVSRCLKRAEPFVVTMIQDGGDPGHTRAAAVGTTAQITDFGQAKDGLLTLATVGVRRARVREVRREPDGLNVGTIELLEPEPRVAVAAEDAVLVGVLRELLPDDEPNYRGLARRWDDATWLGHRLCEQLPLELKQRQVLLELDDARARLEALRPMATALSEQR
jgi:hypothetical protein